MSEVLPQESHQLEHQVSIESRRLFGLSRRELAIAIASTSIVAAALTGVLKATTSPDEEHEQKSVEAVDSYDPPANVQPLGKPLKAPKGVGGYKFLATQPGNKEPVRWNSCKPIHYVVNTDDQPAGGAQAIKKGINTISDVTGLKFINDGTTDENVTKLRPIVNESRYGKGWAPVLVDWVSHKDYPNMGGFVGLGGPDSTTTANNTLMNVSGVVILNQDYFADLAQDGDEGYFRQSAITVHEFGHLVGLDHVNDSSQIMYKQPTLPILGDGDRRGLEILGSGECL